LAWVPLKMEQVVDKWMWEREQEQECLEQERLEVAE